MSEKSRKRIGVPKTMWKKLGRAGQAAAMRMWGDLTRDGSIWMHPDAPKLKREHWHVLRYNMSVIAGSMVREMKTDEDAGIALWIKGDK